MAALEREKYKNQRFAKVRWSLLFCDACFSHVCAIAFVRWLVWLVGRTCGKEEREGGGCVCSVVSSLTVCLQSVLIVWISIIRATIKLDSGSDSSWEVGSWFLSVVPDRTQAILLPLVIPGLQLTFGNFMFNCLL